MKHHCTVRAEWRLQLGKPSERLSTHYRLACDYGTPVVTCWEEGGSEPLYLCETHAKKLGHTDGDSSGVRTITDPAAQSNEKNGKPLQAIPPTPHDVRKQPETAPHAEIVDAIKQNPADSASRASAPEAADSKPVASALPEPARSSVSEAKPGRAAKDPPTRPPARNLTYGNPAKAMVDEAIWNLATGDYEAYRGALRDGKSVAEAAQAAGGQLAVVHRKIIDYTLKLEACLSESAATINVRAAIDKPLEQSMLEIIGSEALSDAEKDDSIQQMGALEEWIKHGLNADVTPLEANRIIEDIGDHLNWGGSASVPDRLKPAYASLYGSLKSSLCAAVPDAQNLHDRLTNLRAAKSDLENVPQAKVLKPMMTA